VIFVNNLILLNFWKF